MTFCLLYFKTQQSRTLLSFSEALIGLIMVAMLMAYLPTMYAAFSRREQAVSMLEVRAGNPPSALEMLLRFNRIHGLDKLSDYWKTWEAWFADIEESHTIPNAGINCGYLLCKKRNLCPRGVYIARPGLLPLTTL